MSRRSISWFLNLLLGGVVFSSAATLARAERAFGPAETLAYECKFLGLTVGKAQVVVGAPTTLAGQTVWPIIGLGKTDSLFALFPIKDKFVTWWNPTKHLTAGTELMADEKNKRRRERIRFDREKRSATVVRESDGEAPVEETHEVDPLSQDILASVFFMREKRLAPGDHEETPVFTGGKEFRLKADVEKRETVEVPAGKFPSVVLRVQVQFSGKLASKRDLRVHLTDDSRHIPVRLDAEFLVGTLSADLVSYQKGIP